MFFVQQFFLWEGALQFCFCFCDLILYIVQGLLCSFQLLGDVQQCVINAGKIAGWVIAQFDVMDDLSRDTEVILPGERTVVGRECESGVFSEYGTAVLDRLFADL